MVGADRFPAGGVFIYAMMAAGGDLGASIGPQLVGVVTDLTMESTYLSEIAATLSLSADQLGMKLGLLVGMLLSLIGGVLAFFIWRGRKQKNA